jgi:hypothetical protein
MVDNYIIETDFGAAGLVVRSGRDFMFFSAKKEFNALEGRLFSSPERAVKAAIQQEAKGRPGFRTSAK